MPDPQYKPNDPRYYSFRNEYGNMGNLIGGQMDGALTAEESKQAKASIDNYRAYVTSRLPWKASPEKVIKGILEIVPTLQVDQALQEKRRQMSEKAKHAIIKTAPRRAFVMDGRPIINRLDSCFYYRGNSIDIKERNDQVQQQLWDGTPEDRGRMLQDRVNNIYGLYQRVLNHQVQDDELLERLEDFHILQDLVMNAQNFIAETKPDPKTGQIYITYPPELGKILKDMEKNSSEIFLFVERVRIMANANYEFLDLEQILDFDNEKYDKFFDYVTDDDVNDPVMNDAAQFVGTTRLSKRSAGGKNVMRQIRDDFPEECEGATLNFIGSNRGIYETPYTTGSSPDIEAFFDHGGVLVTTPSGKAACYYLDNATGRVREADSSAVYSQVAALAAGTFTNLKKANKGFFIGSKEYRKALKDMPEILNNIKEIGDPPDLEKMEQASAKLRETLENAGKYLERKAAGRSYTKRIQEMTPRERIRYDAMEKLSDYCKMQLKVYELKRQEMQAQRDMLLGDEEEAEKSAFDVFPKVNDVYGKEIPPASGVENIADQLRADIRQNLDEILTEDGFNPDKARDTLSKMVLLEIIKMGRGVNTVDGELGVTRVSELEKSLAQKREATVMSVRNHPYIQAATENLDMDMLRQFVMTDRARAVAVKLTQMAAEKAHGNKDSELQMQNEQEKNKQQNALVK